MSSTDTVIMFKEIGGKNIIIDREYFLRCDSINLNIKGVSIKSYSYGWWGGDSVFLNEGRNIPTVIYNLAKDNLLGFFINDIVIISESNETKKLNTEFIIYFK